MVRLPLECASLTQAGVVSSAYADGVRASIEFAFRRPAASARASVEALAGALFRAYDHAYFGNSVTAALRNLGWGVIVSTDASRISDRLGVLQDFYIRPQMRVHVGDDESFVVLELIMDVSYDRDAMITPDTPIRVAGVRCTSPLRCLMLQVEHQLAHVVTELACGRPPYFASHRRRYAADRRRRLPLLYAIGGGRSTAAAANAADAEAANAADADADADADAVQHLHESGEAFVAFHGGLAYVLSHGPARTTSQMKGGDDGAAAAAVAVTAASDVAAAAASAPAPTTSVIVIVPPAPYAREEHALGAAMTGRPRRRVVVLDALPHSRDYRAIARNVFHLDVPEHGSLHGRTLLEDAAGLSSTDPAGLARGRGGPVASNLGDFDSMFFESAQTTKAAGDLFVDVPVYPSIRDTPLFLQIRKLLVLGKGAPVYSYDPNTRAWRDDGVLGGFQGDLAVVLFPDGARHALAPPMVRGQPAPPAMADKAKDDDGKDARNTPLRPPPPRASGEPLPSAFYSVDTFPREMAVLAQTRLAAEAATTDAETGLRTRRLVHSNPMRYFRPVVLVRSLDESMRYGLTAEGKVPIEHLVPSNFVGRFDARTRSLQD